MLTGSRTGTASDARATTTAAGHATAAASGRRIPVPAPRPLIPTAVPITVRIVSTPEKEQRSQISNFSTQFARNAAGHENHFNRTTFAFSERQIYRLF